MTTCEQFQSEALDAYNASRRATEQLAAEKRAKHQEMVAERLAAVLGVPEGELDYGFTESSQEIEVCGLTFGVSCGGTNWITGEPVEEWLYVRVYRQADSSTYQYPVVSWKDVGFALESKRRAEEERRRGCLAWLIILLFFLVGLAFVL